MEFVERERGDVKKREKEGGRKRITCAIIIKIDIELSK